MEMCCTVNETSHAYSVTKFEADMMKCSTYSLHWQQSTPNVSTQQSKYWNAELYLISDGINYFMAKLESWKDCAFKLFMAFAIHIRTIAGVE